MRRRDRQERHGTRWLDTPQQRDLQLRDVHMRQWRNDQRAVGDSDDGTLFGHFTVYNDFQVIRDWLGEYEERILPGAFTKTLRERVPRVMFDHGQNADYGPHPIAVHQLHRDDPSGPYVEAALLETHPRRDLTVEMIQRGAISGMSFQFEVMNEEWEYADSDDPDALDRRTIQQVRLYEYGPVVWPAYEGTDVGVRMDRLPQWAVDMLSGNPQPLPSTSGRAADGHPIEAADTGRNLLGPSDARRALARMM